MRSAGIRIALDDFGTGYSSLYHLRNFKLDKIKIDRSFVDAMATDSDSAAIVSALIGLGAGLGLEVTAEGVETEEQRESSFRPGVRARAGIPLQRSGEGRGSAGAARREGEGGASGA